MTMFNIHEVSEPTAERVQRDGREYLTFPVVPLREMVYEYPEEGTREYLPAEHIAASVDAWAGTPVTAVHPPDRGAGQTVRTPESYTSEVIGQVHRPEALNGGEKLRVHALVDIEKARDVGGLAADVVDLLEAGETLSVSPGYATLEDEYRAGTFEGDAYNLVQGVPLPDHVAVFPSDEFRARCSPEEGCAAPRMNASDGDNEETMTGSQLPPEATVRESDRRRLGSLLLNTLGFGDDDEFVTNHDECGCGGDHGDCQCDAEDAETGTDDDPAGAGDDDVGAQTADDGGDAAGSDGVNDTQTSPMSDGNTGRLEQLAEDSVFSVETLEAMSDDELEAVESDFDASTESTETTDSPDGVDADADVEELKANYEQLQSEVEQLKEERDRAEKRDDVRVVTNALDIDEEKAYEMDDEVLSELADSHRDTADQRTNYGAMPGSVDRTPDSDDESEAYPPAGRAAYEARKED